MENASIHRAPGLSRRRQLVSCLLLGALLVGCAAAGAGDSLPPVGGADRSRPLLQSSGRVVEDVDAERAGRLARTSRLRAIGASLLLPGWGQWLTGHRDRAKAFFAVEAGILISYVAFTVQGHVRRNGYIEQAERFAGVRDAGGKPDWYYSNLGTYNSSDDYVEEIARVARAMFGDDLESREEHIARNSPRADETWQWRSEADRLEYRARRKASRNAFRSATHTLGVALLNRLLSAVDAAILAGKQPGERLVYYRPEPDGPGYLCVRWALD